MDDLEDVENKLEIIKVEQQISRLHRQEKLEMLEDYLGFVTTKTAGAALVVTGILEILSPELIKAVLPEPAGLAGIGFALLAGRRAVRLLEKAVEVLKK